MSLFPIMPYGPIVRYEEIRSQFICRSASIVNISEGMGRFIIGLAKKVLLADQLSLIADQFLGADNIEMQTVLGSWYVLLPLHFRCILHFPDLQIWQLVLERYLDFVLRKTSIIPLCAVT